MDPVLETGRLALREIELDDAPFLHELMNEAPWLRYIGDRGIHDHADARAFIADRLRPSYAEYGFGFWLVELRGEGIPLGICGLIKRNTLDDVDIGFAFCERYWGFGYAREAAEAVVDYARDEVGLERLAAMTHPDNEPSIRLVEALGLRFERMIRLEGEDRDVRFFARDF